MTERRHTLGWIATFFKGSGGVLILVVLTGVLMYFGRTFITLPVPSDYVDKVTFSTLSQAHTGEIAKLKEQKLDKDEFEKRHQDLKDSIETKLSSIMTSAANNEKMLTRLIFMHVQEKKDK